MTERETELVAMIQELVYAMHLWGCDADGIAEEAYPSLIEAARLTDIPRTVTVNEDNDVEYTFDKNWLQLQRVTQDMRKDQYKREVQIKETLWTDSKATK